LRIIVSTIGSVTYKIAEFLRQVLHNSIINPSFFIKDSWTFVIKIHNTNIGSDEILISLDATSLFINIPKELVFKAMTNRWNCIEKNTKLNLEQFLHAIDTMLSSTNFCFDGKKGLAAGAKI